LVLNGAVARVGNKTNYVLQRLYGLCPEVFQEHFYLVFTKEEVHKVKDKQRLQYNIHLILNIKRKFIVSR